MNSPKYPTDPTGFADPSTETQAITSCIPANIQPSSKPLMIHLYVSSRRITTLYSILSSTSDSTIWSWNPTLIHPQSSNASFKHRSTTHLITIPSPCSYTQLLSSISTIYHPGKEAYNPRYLPDKWHYEEVTVESLRVVWDLGTLGGRNGAAGEGGFTTIGKKDGECERVLEMVERRGWRDVVLVYYEPTGVYD